MEDNAVPGRLALPTRQVLPLRLGARGGDKAKPRGSVASEVEDARGTQPDPLHC